MIVDKFFRPDYEERKPFFDEGPRIPPTKVVPINSGSIDTSQIDAWRQGIEISDIKHFDAGIVKIHAGEPGHVLPQKHIGYGTSFRADEDVWSEVDLFDPVLFIKAQGDGDQFISSSVTITWPIVTKDYDASDNFEFDGVIEPFTIRAQASFFSIDMPWEAHAPRAALMGGNLDPLRASSRIETVDYFNPEAEYIGYLDLVDMLGNVPLNGFFRSEQTPLQPFVDQRLPRDIPLSENYSEQLGAALSKVYVSGSESITYKSTDSYVKYNQISATAGFTFDATQGVGTDSLAFGGLVF